MAKIRITKEFRFEMAHILWNYDGLCRNIHGHSYRLYVTIIGEPSVKKDSASGMVMDFAILKNIVTKEIIDYFDHSVVVNSQMPNFQIESIKEVTQRCVIVDFQPTCENLLIYFSQKIKNLLPNNVKLFSLKMYETAGSFAEWFADDNDNKLK